MARAFAACGPLALVMLVLACGGGDGDGEAGSPSPGATLSATARPRVTATGEPLSDEAYLAVFCSGATKYRLALNTESRDGLIKVIEDYIDSMSNVVPPRDAAEFHESFITYLIDALEEPTRLLTRDPPKPPEDVRSRLAGKTGDVPECEYPTFLDGQ